MLEDERTLVGRLVEAGVASAHQHVHVMIDRLFRDGPRSAGALAILRAVLHVHRTLTCAAGHVRGEHGWCRVGQLGRRHVTGPQALLLGELENGRKISVVAG